MTESNQPPAFAMSNAAAIIDELGAAVARNWGWMLARGLLGIGVGLFALVFPQVTIGAMVLLFAFYAIVDGIVAIAAAVRAMRRDQSWAWLLFQGVISLGAAAVALFMPLLAIKVFLYIMAFWAILGGVALIIAAFKLAVDHGRWWLAIGGGLSILWGVLLVSQPAIGAIVLAIWFGIYTMVFGILFTVIGLTLRGRHKERLARA
jgi:uncharacterized membrane protein HdeD (DUF308 family)